VPLREPAARTPRAIITPHRLTNAPTASDTDLVEDAARERPRSLAQLNKEERSLSARRTRLQRRIDFLRAGASDGSVEDVAALLAELEEEERELSRRRRELHDHIEVARANARRSRI
jgi:hypothetical protein